MSVTANKLTWLNLRWQFLKRRTPPLLIKSAAWHHPSNWTMCMAGGHENCVIRGGDYKSCRVMRMFSLGNAIFVLKISFLVDIVVFFVWSCSCLLFYCWLLIVHAREEKETRIMVPQLPLHQDGLKKSHYTGFHCVLSLAVVVCATNN